MLDIRVNTKDLERLADGMGRYSHNIPTPEVNRLLRKSVRPMYRRLQKEVPVSRSAEYINIKRVRNKKNANAYRQGGSTRRDLRIKAVQPRGGEIGRVAVGVSRKSGKVGWRTPFITGGTKERFTKKGVSRGKMKKDDFLTRSYEAEVQGSADNFSKDFKNHFDTWAKNNLPQNY